MVTQTPILSTIQDMCLSDWGEPERAPHKREVRAACLSVCLSVRS